MADAKANPDWLRHRITNGLISAEIALPEAKKGFYRGMRFDRAGIITSLRYRGHEFFAGNFTATNRNPVIHDHVAGQAEEFAEPIGYDDAKVGDGFLKIGVGILRKPFYPVYAFRVPYKPVKIFSWTTKLEPKRVEFTQYGNMKEYSYVYRKTISLISNKPELKSLMN